MRTIISEYQLGDMMLIYQQGRDRKGNDCTGMLLIPAAMRESVLEDKEYDVEPLIQCKIVGDDYPFNYSHGRTMRGSQSGFLMKYERQYEERQEESRTIVTVLKDARGINYEHCVRFWEQDKAVYTYGRVQNESGEPITFEMLSSFTLGGLTPFENGTAPETMVLHQIRSTWANEGRLVSRPIEEYQLEPSWKPSGANGIRFGQIGSMPNREYFPFIGIEDKKNRVSWGVQLAIGSSWQLEAYRKDDALTISGGIADREKGHWMKKLGHNEIFVTPQAIITTVQGNTDLLCQRITAAVQNHLMIHPDEEKLPIVFNEFCTTWGNPEESRMKQIIDLVSRQGVSYFVIDAGWYKTKTGKNDQWAIEHGDWVCSEELYPQGIGSLVNYIHEKGMKAGIWFEFENCGRESKAFQNTELLCHRDGYPITVGNRRFFDMTDEKVWEYLDEHVLKFLKEKKFDYIKVDYNANLGIGPESGESPGEALYEGVLATRRYFRHLKEEIPGLLIENCSAGGHRLVEPFLSITDMSSYSDAHESMNIPLVAANMHRMIPIRQSQIWAVLHPEFSERMLYYKLSSTFLGRMCLSGNVEELSGRQWEIVQSAVSFYQECRELIVSGVSEIETVTGLSYKEPTGYQIVRRRWKEKELLVIHTFENAPEQIEVEEGEQTVISEIWMHPEIRVSCEKGKLVLQGLQSFDGGGILFVEKPEKSR